MASLLRLPRARRRAASFVALPAALLALLAVVSIGACSQGSVTETDAPKCRAGFRNQCVADAQVGARFACALLADRTVWCWGRNDQGQLGYSTTDLCPDDIGGGKTQSFACHTFPFQVVGLDDAVALQSGDAFSCAQRTDGSLACWGSGAAGELGNGASLTSLAPVAVAGLPANVTSFALGAQHACALADGKVYCWGADDHGQLGAHVTGKCTVDGASIACANAPVLVTDVADAVEITAGAGHTCARLADGTVTCWGDNRYGQLGVGTASATPPPLGPVMLTQETALGGALQIAAGASHTCALRDGGEVFCWGRDDHRELGAPPPGSGPVGCPGPCSALAVKVPDLPSAAGPDAGVDAASDATGDATSDAPIVDAPSDVAAHDDSGADGRPTDARPEATSSETAIDADPGATGVGALGRVLTSGDSFSCVRFDDGTARCWGVDTVGQLGDGKTTSDPQGPTLVIASPGAAADNPLQGVRRVRAGGASACAVMTDDSLRCWGSNQDGVLGVGQVTAQRGPVPVGW